MSHLASESTSYIDSPLIDAPLSHPDTVFTSIMYIEKFMKAHGQKYIHLVADLQIYKVAIQFKWSCPTRWKSLIIRPGGMHTLTFFLGCAGNLMKGSGLEEILYAAYNGVSSNLHGKAWLKALRGIRMVITGLFRDYVLAGRTTYDAREKDLKAACLSKMARLWVNCFIYPVLLAHMFVRGEREGNYVLHMYCLARMVTYVFAAEH